MLVVASRHLSYRAAVGGLYLAERVGAVYIDSSS